MKISAKAREYFGLLKDSGMRMSEDQVPMMGAALAYYMMFSIAPRATGPPARRRRRRARP